jgi:hypothetical protein
MRLQLEYWAQQTGTVAPQGGLDCDGGGTPDVAGGGPLVCSVKETGAEEAVGETLVTLLRTFRTEKTVQIVPSRTSGLSVAVQNGAKQNVDIRSDNEIGGTAVVSCTQEQTGKRYPIEFDVLVGGKKVDTLPGTAQCGAIAAAAAATRARPGTPSKQNPEPGRESPAPTAKQPAPKAPAGTPAPASQPTPQSAAVLAPSPPPPSPVPISSGAPASAASPSPAAAPASAPAPAQSAVGQAAIAPAEQRRAQTQVATVHADGSQAMTARGKTQDFAMVSSRTRARSALPAPAAITLGGGLLAIAAWVLVEPGYRRRRMRQVARVESRR